MNLYQVEPLLREGLTTINNLKSLDFQALTLKDVVTLIGLTYSGCKGLVALWQLWKAVQQHGLSKVMRPDLKNKYGRWAGALELLPSVTSNLSQNYCHICSFDLFCSNVTVVTGCSRGVGAAYVAELAACCLNVVLISRPNPKLAEFAAKIGAERFLSLWLERNHSI